MILVFLGMLSFFFFFVCHCKQKFLSNHFIVPLINTDGLIYVMMCSSTKFVIIYIYQNDNPNYFTTVRWCVANSKSLTKFKV